MSAAVVEVKDFETFAFYKAYIKDFQNGKLLVHYEHGWKPDEWVDCSSVRQSVPPHNPQLFDPRVGDSVEALAKSHEDEPYSWWRAKVKTIKGEFYLINYSDWDDTYNEIVEKELLRPPNPNPSLVAGELTKKELDLPAEIRQTEEERKDPMTQKQKQADSAELQQQSGVLTLLEDPVRNKLVILGHHKAVERAALLASIHFKHQKQLKELQSKKQKLVQTLEESKKRLQNGYVEEFTVDKALIGFVIGKAGSNIRNAEKCPGVESIRVHSENAQIIIVAKDKESALAARKMVEFIQETFSVPRSQIARFVGAKYAHIREIEKNSGVTRIKVPSDNNRNNSEDAPAEPSSRGRSGYRGRARGGRGGGGRSYNNNQYESDEPVGIEVVGTRDSVHNAIMLMQHHLKYIMEAQAIVDEERHVSDQLRQLNNAYGIRAARPRENNRENADGADGENNNRRRRGGKKQDDAVAGGDEAKTEAKQPESEEEKARRKARNEERAKRRAANKEKDGAAPSDEAAAPAAAENGDKPKKGRARKPVTREDAAAAAGGDQL